MRTITIEEHFLSDGVREAIHRNAPGQGIIRFEPELVDLNSTRLKAMDAAGIDFQIISHMTSSVLTHPGFATLPMAHPQAAADELERTVRSFGFKGALINGTTNGLFLDDPSFMPILERAVALHVPIYVHPAEPPAAVKDAYYSGFDPSVSYVLSTTAWGWHSETAIHALRLILAGVFDRLPDLQIIIGHMGEMIPFMFTRIGNVFGPVAKHLQHPVPEYFLRNFYITTSAFFTEPPFLLALQIMGADRIIFSVDYPYSTNEQGRVFLDNVSISPADKEKISHLNVERLLRLE